jgi:ABC-type sugar transport system ATPase subunit
VAVFIASKGADAKLLASPKWSPASATIRPLAAFNAVSVAGGRQKAACGSSTLGADIDAACGVAPSAPCQLSGGNQQKTVIGKWLEVAQRD